MGSIAGLEGGESGSVRETETGKDVEESVFEEGEGERALKLVESGVVEVRDEGGKWLVLLSRGEGIDSSSFVTSIDKTTGEVDEAYWVVA